MTIFERVYHWYSLRYERTYSKSLTISLLKEELEEFHESENLLGEVDALCDLMFVSIGALWRLDIDDKLSSIEENINGLKTFLGMEPVFLVDACIRKLESYEKTEKLKIAETLYAILGLCIDHFKQLGFDYEKIEKALYIVCDSNDSKEVVKTPKHVKANIDKGPNYVSPNKKLKELLENLQ